MEIRSDLREQQVKTFSENMFFKNKKQSMNGPLQVNEAKKQTNKGVHANDELHSGELYASHYSYSGAQFTGAQRKFTDLHGRLCTADTVQSNHTLVHTYIMIKSL